MFFISLAVVVLGTIALIQWSLFGLEGRIVEIVVLTSMVGIFGILLFESAEAAYKNRTTRRYLGPLKKFAYGILKDMERIEVSGKLTTTLRFWLRDGIIIEHNPGYSSEYSSMPQQLRILHPWRFADSLVVTRKLFYAERESFAELEKEMDNPIWTSDREGLFVMRLFENPISRKQRKNPYLHVKLFIQKWILL